MGIHNSCSDRCHCCRSSFLWVILCPLLPSSVDWCVALFFSLLCDSAHSRMRRNMLRLRKEKKIINKMDKKNWNETNRMNDVSRAGVRVRTLFCSLPHTHTNTHTQHIVIECGPNYFLVMSYTFVSNRFRCWTLATATFALNNRILILVMCVRLRFIAFLPSPSIQTV